MTTRRNTEAPATVSVSEEEYKALLELREKVNERKGNSKAKASARQDLIKAHQAEFDRLVAGHGGKTKA